MPVLLPNLSTGAIRRRRRDPSLPFSADSRHGGAMGRLHLHLISDSTGETLENIAKAALAQFDDVEVVRHFWPMVRSESHLDRIIADEIGRAACRVRWSQDGSNSV